MRSISIHPDKTTLLYCIVFIHFYSASHSMSSSEALPTRVIDTVSEFTRRSGATSNCKRRTCPRALCRLGGYSNPRPSGRKASTLSMSHHATHLVDNKNALLELW